jgi:hypothetical protein
MQQEVHETARRGVLNQKASGVKPNATNVAPARNAESPEMWPLTPEN